MAETGITCLTDSRKRKDSRVDCQREPALQEAVRRLLQEN